MVQGTSRRRKRKGTVKSRRSNRKKRLMEKRGKTKRSLLEEIPEAEAEAAEAEAAGPQTKKDGLRAMTDGELHDAIAKTEAEAIAHESKTAAVLAAASSRDGRTARNSVGGHVERRIRHGGAAAGSTVSRRRPAARRRRRLGGASQPDG